MKTWIQVLAGVVVGALLALLLPVNSIIITIIKEITTTVISLGRYIVLPLLFFSLIVSVAQLEREKKFTKNILVATGVIIGFTLLLVVFGVLASLIYSPGQIPVVIDSIQDINVPKFSEILSLSIPSNIFTVFQNSFNQDANMFMPLFILAIILGYFLTKSDREEVEPTFNLVDSLSRIFYKINEYFYKLSFVWVTLLTTKYVSIIRNIADIKTYLPLIFMLIAMAIITVFIIYPIIFYNICGKRNFFSYLLREFPTLITSAITGDQFFTATSLIPAYKKDFRIKRKISGFNIPFLTLFSKSGTALVSVISFTVILKSYSSLEIQPAQILWVGYTSLFISFIIPSKAVGSSIASLFLLCSLYGHGGTMEDSFIILSPVFPVIAGVATLINTVTIIMISLVLDPAKREIETSPV